MNSLIDSLWSFGVTVAVAVLILLVLSVVIQIARNNYIKVPPNTAAIISGRNHTIQTPDGEQKIGFRIVRGGGTLVWPFFERLDTLDLTIVTIPDLNVQRAITKEGVPLSVKAVANIRIGNEDVLLSNAASRLLRKEPAEIRRMAYETLEGHLRSMLGTMTVEQINADRQQFQAKMVSESQQDLAKLGLIIDVLTIKELSDDSKYLEALGKKRTAEVQRDAEIGAAQAAREATIQSTTARREGEVAKQNNEALTADAEKEKNVKIAKFKAETNAEQARAEQAGPLATAEARKAVVEREQEVLLAQTKKATDVAEARAAQREKELVAETIKPAEAERDAAIARANGVARAKVIEAEADARSIQIRAEAEQRRLTAEGLGRAEAKKAELLAEAEGSKAKLLAEAEGVLKKAEAYQKLDESGRLLQILEAAQTLIPHAIKEFAEVVKGAAEPLGQADKIIVIDSGGNNGYGGALDRFAGVVPNLIFSTLEKLGAMGIDVRGALQKTGVTVDDKSTETQEKEAA